MFSVDLSGKGVFITGGSRGIGRAAALAFADAGCDVAIGYRAKKAEADAALQEIAARGRKGVAVEMDVASQDSCEAAYAKVVAAIGKVDVLVNNAGVVKDDLFAMLDDDAWKAVLDVNVMGVVHTTRLAAKDMMMRRYGRIINLSSAAASKGGRGQANYAASKGAVEAMTRSLAVELAKRGVTVNCIAPGVVETDMSAEVRKIASEEILSRQLLKRYAQPDEIAAWAVFIASRFGDFMTGEVIHIDGGLKMP